MSSRLDRLKAAADGIEVKPHVVQVESKAVGQSDCEGNDSRMKPSHSGECGVPSVCCAVVNGAESDETSAFCGVGARGAIKDTRLIEKALREEWPITPKLRRKAIRRLSEALDSESVREQLAAVNGIQKADLINLAIEKQANPKTQVSVHVNINADDRAREIKTLLGESVTRRLGVDDASG
jgi:hypothetical protein